MPDNTRRTIQRILHEAATPRDVRRWAGITGEIEEIGKGYHGTAYYFNGQVLKITDDEDEDEDMEESRAVIRNMLDEAIGRSSL